MNCTVCLEPFNATQRRPKVMPCGHTFCMSCLQALPRKECPECRKVFNGMDKLLDNFTLLRMLERPIKKTPRFWCQDCKRVATDLCVEEHSVCSLKKARNQSVQPCLDELHAGSGALFALRDLLDVTVDHLERLVAGYRGKLDAAQTELDDAGRRLEAVLEAEEAVFEEARARAADFAMRRLPKAASHLLHALANPAFECSVTLGDLWQGSMQPKGDVVAMLMLFRLVCDDRLRLHQQPAALARGDGQEKQQSQQGAADRVSAREFTVPAEASRWQERSNEGETDILSVEDMAKKLVVGSRVVRGRDWQPGWTCDGTPPGQGTVTSVGPGSVTVKWDCGGLGFAFKVGAERQYQLQLSSCSISAEQMEVELPVDMKTSDATFHDLKGISTSSDITAKSKLLAGQDITKVRALIGLHCDVSSTWSSLLLKKAAPNLEVLELRGPGTEHLEVVARMPRLHSLHLDCVNMDSLRLALSVPSLRRLEVHCSFRTPLVAGQGGQGLRLPVAPALEWLRVGVYPLAAALAVARAHAATLRELELVAASDQPYGCPDLAKELADCGLRNLQMLVLRRFAPHHTCRHDQESCKRQKMQLWDMFLQSEFNVLILCNVCDKLIS